MASSVKSKRTNGKPSSAAHGKALDAAFDQIRELEQDPGTVIVAGHDPAVLDRFPGRPGSDYVVRVS